MTVRTDSILDAIVARKREDLSRHERELPVGEVRRRAEQSPLPRPFAAALRRPTLSVIAEFKRASPSRGAIAQSADPSDVARTYGAGGATAISVLTEEHRFGGSLADLMAVREAVDTPVLRKDFLFDPRHLFEARVAGADAVLLIVAMLEEAALLDLQELARALGLDTLVEVHTATELERALRVGARLIGINNRDLHSFSVDLATFERLARLVPPDCVLVAESGVFGEADARRMRVAGADAILVGEALMRAGLASIGPTIASFRGSPSA
ncbi:MAG: indole-3-glycerol phosphate synthase TrpC [Chloroflexi bacterium]|nr:indole-3-glycerol phosphate synthase TrpC [Chloroflexota bacterium]